MGSSIACLATDSDPALGYWLRGLVDAGFTNLRLIFDRKVTSQKDLQIWEERTAGRLPAIPLSEFPTVKKFWVENHNSEEARELMSLCLLALNCGTPRKLDQHTLETPPLGVINSHPGSLPNYRGATAVEWALYERQPIIATAHFMGAEIDTGAVLLEREVKVTNLMSYTDIRCATYRATFDLLPLAVTNALSESFEPIRTISDFDGAQRKPIPPDLFNDVLSRLPA